MARKPRVTPTPVTEQVARSLLEMRKIFGHRWRFYVKEHLHRDTLSRAVGFDHAGTIRHAYLNNAYLFTRYPDVKLAEIIDQEEMLKVAKETLEDDDCRILDDVELVPGGAWVLARLWIPREEEPISQETPEQ